MSDPPVGARIRLAIKAVTPPILWNALKRVKEAAKRHVRAERGPAHEEPPESEPVRAEEPPEWEYVPEGWARPVGGWDAGAVAEAYRRKWPAYLAAVEGAGPLGIHHEMPEGQEIGRTDVAAHNTVVSFGYVAALAARARDRLSVLDWGGGLGHSEPLTRAFVPRVELDYHCREVPSVAAVGAEINPRVRFHSDDSCLARRYDLVLASGSFQYAEDWVAFLPRLAGATARYLFVTRLPVALDAPSFVVLQRAHAYGYATEYLGWVVNREELLSCAAASDLELVREFVLDARFSAAGAPEDPVEHRGFLFRPAAPA